MSSLIQSPLSVINIGLSDFGRELAETGTPVTSLDWTPPAGGDKRLIDALDRLKCHHSDVIDAANETALSRMLSADPVLIGVERAGDVIDGLKKHMILHAGPPVKFEDMCGPMRGAVCGIIVYEGWAPNLESAGIMAAAGDVEFHPNHHFDAVGPMTGMTTISQPVMVVENRSFSNRAFCTLNEGLGKVMRFGGNDDEVIDRLHWLARVLGPILQDSLNHAGGIGLKNIIARGLSMGDEMHQRNVACTSLFIREIAPHVCASTTTNTLAGDALAFMAGNDQFFLNIAMAMGKSIMDPVKGIPGSSVVTAMSRNGTEFGIRMSASKEQWFTAPVEMPRGLYFPGFNEQDANPDMGDSTIVETIGLGGFAMGASPAVAGFVGAGSASDAYAYTERMFDITVKRNNEWTIPGMDFNGVPTGIDVRKVVETGAAPTINTGIAHRQPGVGQVGAGIVRAPVACFSQALLALAESLDVST